MATKIIRQTLYNFKLKKFAKLSRKFAFVLFVLIASVLFLLFIHKYCPPIYAANVLSNPSFTDNTTGWTLSTTVYDSTIFQDSAGSIRTQTVVGRNNTAVGTADQVISTQIEAGSTVYLNFYWSKQCVAINCTTNTIEIQRILSGVTTTIWSNTTVPAFGARTAWAQVANVNVSASFTTTGSYTFQVYMSLRNGNATAAQSLAWVDNINLDVIPPNITVGTTGTQTSTLMQGEPNAYLGGAFTFVRNTGSATVSSITVSELGTIADSNISGLILYYKEEATCSTSIPEGTTQFNSTPGTFSSGSSTVTGSMSVGTSQICVYAEVDIGSGAGIDDTVEIQITNPSTQVTASMGTVSPATAVAISGTTTIIAAGNLTLDIVDGGDVSVPNPSFSFSAVTFDWSANQSTAVLGTSSQRIWIKNNTVSPNWTMSISATNGEATLWDSGTYSYKYNGSESEGRLQVNPNPLTITPGSGCNATGLTKQSSAYFVNGSVSSIDIIIADGTAQTDCNWYIEGIGLLQDIPAQQSIASYSINMTLTVI